MNPAPNIEVVRCLIQAGADINLENHMGYTPLHFAVIQRKRLVVKELIEQGALINAQNYLGMSALHFAVSDFALFGTPILDRTHLDIWIVEKLLKHQNIDRDLMNSNGDTPLMLSAKDYHIESAVQLLRSKANPNICNKDFQTPLHVALTHPPSDIEIELLICGANLYAVDRHGITPLDILMKFTLDDENEEWVCELFAREMNTKHQFYGGTTPFRWALIQWKRLVAKEFIEHGALINAQNYPVTSALHFAVSDCSFVTLNSFLASHLPKNFGHLVMVRCLIQAGADINLANHKGYTPLHFAVIQRKRLVVKELIEHGALINAQNYLGMSALHFAVSDYTLTGMAFIDHKHLDMWIVKELLKHEYIDHDILNSNGDTPLMLSVKEYHIEFVEQLLRSKANPNICNKDFETPLHVAFSHPPSCIEIELLIRGANIYAVDRNGNTPLDILINNTFYDENKEWVNFILKLIAFKYCVTNDLKLALQRKPELFQFWNKCCDQVNEMRSDFITENITMHDFIWNCFNENQIENLILQIHKPVVDRLARDIYPDYFAEIFIPIPKWNLCQILEITACCKKRADGSKVRNLAYLLSKIDIIYLISKHLRREDIFCLIVAFYDMRIPKSLQDEQGHSYRFLFTPEFEEGNDAHMAVIKF
ncbi:ankyrin-3-like [Argiope bruennichi]|uniref:ankyrin-3-like n=1 Tax=Argiope bruennichi TaxID=94029 RepID=UPI0024959D91|nr:ankyrin-3-like [Argiope bruennichi]